MISCMNKTQEQINFQNYKHMIRKDDNHGGVVWVYNIVRLDGTKTTRHAWTRKQAISDIVAMIGYGHQVFGTELHLTY